jgi:hypothetical protein
MAEIKDLSTTDASNNGSAANAGFPEGMAPSDVNNAARALEGMLARWYKDGNGTLTTGGSANTYTLTPNRTISAYADGDAFLVEFNATNTGATTINVSTLGAKSIVTPSGTALAAGDIVSGGRYVISYDGTNFQLLGSIGDGAISNARIRDSAGLSVIGRSANTTGDVADITAANDAEVLRRSGTSIGFGTIATAGIADDAVTYAKIQDVSATSRILGRATAGAGVIEELTGTQVGTIVGSATTSASGVVELATAAEILTGTDDTRPMVPGFFADNASFTATGGYYKLPGGLIIQWGETGSISSNGSTTVTLPTAYSNTTYTAVAIGVRDDASETAIQIGTRTTTTLQIHNAGGNAADGATWVTFGT